MRISKLDLQNNTIVFCSDFSPLKTRDVKPLLRRLYSRSNKLQKKPSFDIKTPTQFQLVLDLMINISVYNPTEKQLSTHKKQNLTWFNCAFHAQSTFTEKATEKRFIDESNKSLHFH